MGGYIFTVFMGFFAIMNPIANVPIFLSLTADNSPEETRSIARRAVWLAFLIVVVFAVAGNLIFQVFDISLDAFQITGGLLVCLIGFHMLQGNLSSMHHLKDSGNPKYPETALSVAVTPLAMPILAGPGTISTTMNFAGNGGLMELAIVIGCFGGLCLLTYWLFISGRSFVAFIGSGALGVITRMMGLILAVIGTQMVLEGIQGAIHTFERPPINQRVSPNLVQIPSFPVES